MPGTYVVRTSVLRPTEGATLLPTFRLACQLHIHIMNLTSNWRKTTPYYTISVRSPGTVIGLHGAIRPPHTTIDDTFHANSTAPSVHHDITQCFDAPCTRNLRFARSVEIHLVFSLIDFGDLLRGWRGRNQREKHVWECISKKCRPFHNSAPTPQQWTASTCRQVMFVLRARKCAEQSAALFRMFSFCVRVS